MVQVNLVPEPFGYSDRTSIFQQQRQQLGTRMDVQNTVDFADMVVHCVGTEG